MHSKNKNNNNNNNNNNNHSVVKLKDNYSHLKDNKSMLA